MFHLLKIGESYVFSPTRPGLVVAMCVCMSVCLFVCLMSPFHIIFLRGRTSAERALSMDWCNLDLDQDRDRTPEHILILGLYSRSRLRSRSHQSADKACSALVRPRKKSHGKGTNTHQTTQKQTDFATTRQTRTRGPSW